MSVAFLAKSVAAKSKRTIPPHQIKNPKMPVRTMRNASPTTERNHKHVSVNLRNHERHFDGARTFGWPRPQHEFCIPDQMPSCAPLQSFRIDSQGLPYFQHPTVIVDCGQLGGIDGDRILYRLAEFTEVRTRIEPAWSQQLFKKTSPHRGARKVGMGPARSSIACGRSSSRPLEQKPGRTRRRKTMSGSSDKMLDLLQQILVLKELDDQSRSGPESESAIQDSKERRKRRQQIRVEMRKLASSARQKQAPRPASNAPDRP
jgi:hypothetical protein